MSTPVKSMTGGDVRGWAREYCEALRDLGTLRVDVGTCTEVVEKVLHELGPSFGDGGSRDPPPLSLADTCGISFDGKANERSWACATCLKQLSKDHKPVLQRCFILALGIPTRDCL